MDGTMVDGDGGEREIEMEMWSCLRCTAGMTEVSSPHLPVAAAEIRKPSNVLCYTHLNGSCMDEPRVAAGGLGTFRCEIQPSGAFRVGWCICLENVEVLFKHMFNVMEMELLLVGI